mmetsp:Transcript_56191/g.137790  ORF Transcript_56191/g.137790 Transcript_56191/m.137790 type:complete len:250 (+) Transcript_56191:178-927(+)
MASLQYLGDVLALEMHSIEHVRADSELDTLALLRVCVLHNGYVLDGLVRANKAFLLDSTIDALCKLSLSRPLLVQHAPECFDGLLSAVHAPLERPVQCRTSLLRPVRLYGLDVQTPLLRREPPVPVSVPIHPEGRVPYRPLAQPVVQVVLCFGVPLVKPLLVVDAALLLPLLLPLAGLLLLLPLAHGPLVSLHDVVDPPLPLRCLGGAQALPLVPPEELWGDLKLRLRLLLAQALSGLEGGLAKDPLVH